MKVQCDSKNSCYLIAAIFQIVRSEHMAAEGDPVAETSKTRVVDSLPVPVPPKKKMKSREGCNEMLEKSFTILTPSAAAAASAVDEECRSFGSFISNKLRNYLPRTRNQVQHGISNIIFAADQGHFDVS
jgi:hypothetical protein